MRVVIGKSMAKGSLQAPPSKSMAHRLIISASLAKGTSLIKGVELSEDVKATLSCLKALGVEYVYDDGTVTVKGVGGIDPVDILNCRECGSTLRFFIPICLLSDREVILTGSDRLMERPLGVYEDLCREKGYCYTKTERGITVRGRIQSGVYTVAGNVSSQFISGLLFALPITDGDSVIRLTGKVESRSYIDMTISALETFGVKVCWQDESTLFVKGGQAYKPADTTVEGDYSNAAFFSALDLFGGHVELRGLKPDSLQGDKVYVEYFHGIKEGNPTLDISDCPDLGPILMAVGAAFDGVTLTGSARLKIKESDRGAAMAAELSKLGAEVSVKENEIIVKGGISSPKEPLFGHNDHRVVMSLAVLLTLCGGEIEGAESVSKSMPRFFEMIKELGVECDIHE